MMNWRLLLFLTASFMYCNASPSFNKHKIKSVGNTVHTRINDFRRHQNGIKRMMKIDQNEPQNTVKVPTKHAKDMNSKLHEHGQDHKNRLRQRQRSPVNTKNDAIYGKGEFNTHVSYKEPMPAKISIDQEQPSVGDTMTIGDEPVTTTEQNNDESSDEETASSDATTDQETMMIGDEIVISSPDVEDTLNPTEQNNSDVPSEASSASNVPSDTSSVSNAENDTENNEETIENSADLASTQDSSTVIEYTANNNSSGSFDSNVGTDTDVNNAANENATDSIPVNESSTLNESSATNVSSSSSANNQANEIDVTNETNDNTDPCDPTPCGIDADCQVKIVNSGNSGTSVVRQPNCFCPEGKVGDPQIKCEAEAQEPDCDCTYNPWLTIGGGCKISEKPPKGYMCHCWRPFFFTCAGDASKCVSEDDEGCSGCMEEECCDPMGNCWGYQEKYANSV